MSAHEQLIALLLDKSVRYGTFTLASGKTSDFYVDARQTTLNAQGSRLIGALMVARLRDDVIGVGGMSLGADPVACATSLTSAHTDQPRHAFLIRKEAKGHGTKRFVEGLENLPEGSKVAVVEDTTTTGGSLLLAVERAREAGLDVVQTLTVVDREEGATEALAAAGLTLEALVTRTQLEAHR